MKRIVLNFNENNPDDIAVYELIKDVGRGCQKRFIVNAIMQSLEAEEKETSNEDFIKNLIADQNFITTIKGIVRDEISNQKQPHQIQPQIQPQVQPPTPVQPEVQPQPTTPAENAQINSNISSDMLAGLDMFNAMAGI